MLSILETGDVFGEIALLDDRPRSASVTAMETCELLVVERRGFRALLGSVPNLAQNLLQVMARRMRDLSDRTQNMSLLNVEAAWPSCSSSSPNASARRSAPVRSC